jgi:uncharacterized protein (TIGR01777 family)
MKVLVTGATGLVGQQLVKLLSDNNHQCVILTRSIPMAAVRLGSKHKYFSWDTNSELDAKVFDGVEAVINLAGENIAAARWSDKQKKKIFDSRINTTKFLVNAIKAHGDQVKVLVQTSAIGIYGDRGSEVLDENSEVKINDFLAEVCQAWEEQTKPLEDKLRVVTLRVGVVLSELGGALGKLLPLFKFGLGGPVGSGKQVMSWIHIQDLIRLYLFALESDQLKAVVNATAPIPVSNGEFSRALGKALKRPAFFWAPGLALELAMGELSSIVLTGQYVKPQAALNAGFQFSYEKIDQAFKDIASRA